MLCSSIVRVDMCFPAVFYAIIIYGCIVPIGTDPKTCRNIKKIE